VSVLEYGKLTTNALPYASSKSAMSTFFTGIRQELQHRKDNISITVVHLGLIPTEHSNDSLNSMSITSGQDLKKEMSILPITSPTKCAEDIVKAAARREAEFYYPHNQGLWIMRIFTILVSDFGAYEPSLHTGLRFLVDVKSCLFGWF
jgi:corticosteroid 11-beta-dehydrogenase isozyme 1